MPAPLEIQTPGDREIVVLRDFSAPPELVWRCYTEPELIKRWYGLPDWEMTVCEFDARVGGKWRYVTKAPDGYEMGSSGEVRELHPPVRIVNTELYDDDWTGGETLNTVVMERTESGTTVRLSVLYASKEAREGALATPMAEGMEIGYRRLDELLAEQPAA